MGNSATAHHSPAAAARQAAAVQADLATVEQAARFCIEVAKGFGAGSLRVCDEGEFSRLVSLCGPMIHLQSPGAPAAG
jgi:hypothetical protein